MKSYMNSKAATVSIVILVLMTLFLITISIAYFISKENVSETIQTPNVVDKVYVQEALLNYHLQKSFDKSFAGISLEDSEGDFVLRFKTELEKYKNSEGEWLVYGMKEVYENIKEDNVKIDSGNLILSLDISLSRLVQTGGIEKIRVDYNYEKEFVKGLG